MHVSAQIWNIGGIVLSVCGVLILFRYGMPYRVRTGGANCSPSALVGQNGLIA